MQQLEKHDAFRFGYFYYAFGTRPEAVDAL